MSENLYDFHKEYLNDVRVEANEEGEFTSDIFLKITLDKLQEMNEFPDYEIINSGDIPYKKKSMQVDAYAYNGIDEAICLVIVDFCNNDEIQSLNLADASKDFQKLYNYLDVSLNGDISLSCDFSNPCVDFGQRLKIEEKQTRKYKFYLLTDRCYSGKKKVLDDMEINNKNIELHIWDIYRLQNAMNFNDFFEEIEINLTDKMDKGLPYLQADNATSSDMRCYLCVMPGKILADLFDQYGSRLLEGNVRSFLSQKVKVNKDIKNTIIKEPKYFFAFNNGISATASNISTSEDKYITHITGLQIVNGGQTTASLSMTRYKYHADLSGIFVQMKLTVIPDNNVAAEMIPQISRASNNQNKVSDADFFSNHQFCIEMEKISRNTLAPSYGGKQYQTYWFFERSRGQYDQATAKMSPTKKNKFLEAHPKVQVIKKTDLAKYRNSWAEHPYEACLGAQKSFNAFANTIQKEWDEDPSKFDQDYFKETVCIAILYKIVDKIVLNAEWYQKGYKANIIAYTLAYFHYLINSQFNGKQLNMAYIWQKQWDIPGDLKNQLADIAKFVNTQITREDRKIVNVTEWTKKEDCWKEICQQKYYLNNNISTYLLSEAQAEDRKKSKRGNKVQNEVKNKGSQYWQQELLWGINQNYLTESEEKLLTTAAQIDKGGQMPSANVCQKILNIDARLRDDGFEE